MPDVLIVGAGPAGAVAGAILARAGVRVRIVDRCTFPRGKLCGDTINAGTLGLLTLTALRHASSPGLLLAVAKYPEQRRLAKELGADVVIEPGEVRRAVRRHTRSLANGEVLSGGADVVVDCVGSAGSLSDALAVTRPKGRIVMVGMAGQTSLDLTPLWHKELSLTGAYAYRHSTFADAFALVREARLERLVSALYPLDRYRDAIEHAATAGARGAVKIAFDLRNERNR